MSRNEKLAEVLIDAVYKRDDEQLLALLAEGTDPNARTSAGTTPLYCAVGNPGAVRALLEAGANPNAESGGETEGTPLCSAAAGGFVATIRELLAGGADPNLCEDAGTGQSPLRWAAGGGYVETVEALLEAGADPDLAGGNAWTPLHAAAGHGSIGVVRALLDAGADPTTRLPDGRTALDVAGEWAGKDVEAELRAKAERLVSGTIRTTRRTLAEGTQEVEVFVRIPPGSGGFGWTQETGHAAIVELLRGVTQRR